MKSLPLLLSFALHGLLFAGLLVSFDSAPLMPKGETLVLNVVSTSSAPKKAQKTVPQKAKRIETQDSDNGLKPAQQSTAKTTPQPTPAQQAGVYGAKDGKVVDSRNRYQFELEAYIQSKLIYPNSARRLNQQGRVYVGFNIEPDGRFSNVKVIRPSRYKKFNRAAVKLIQQAQAFKPPPSGIFGPGHKFSLPVEYVAR